MENKENTQFIVLVTRHFYGPSEEHSLLSTEAGEHIFESREAAQAAIAEREESDTRAYGCYCCAHNESGSPDYTVLSSRHPRAARLLRELTLTR